MLKDGVELIVDKIDKLYEDLDGEEINDIIFNFNHLLEENKRLKKELKK